MWSYIFRNSSSATPPEHGGASFADAIVIKGKDAKTLAGWENTYISLNPCAGGSKRRVVKRESIYNVEGTAYDMITTSCAGKSAPETLYFDITVDWSEPPGMKPAQISSRSQMGENVRIPIAVGHTGGIGVRFPSRMTKTKFVHNWGCERRDRSRSPLLSAGQCPLLPNPSLRAKRPTWR